MTESVWQLLNDLEDSILTGYRTEHEPAPQVVRMPPAASSPSEPENQTESFGGIQGIAEEIYSCTVCGLHTERTSAVPGTGSAQPLVFVVGEGPGADEDRMGLPFVGPSGQYLDKWLKAVDLSRHRNVYITNVVKCRPPGNRNPAENEMAACLPYLYRQIAELQPPMLLLLGRVAAQAVLPTDRSLSALRGSIHEVRGIPAVVTYHPSAVLRNQGLRVEVWNDMQLLRDHLMTLRSDYRPSMR